MQHSFVCVSLIQNACTPHSFWLTWLTTYRDLERRRHRQDRLYTNPRNTVADTKRLVNCQEGHEPLSLTALVVVPMTSPTASIGSILIKYTTSFHITFQLSALIFQSSLACLHPLAKHHQVHLSGIDPSLRQNSVHQTDPSSETPPRVPATPT